MSWQKTKARFLHALQGWDYEIFLPLLARLPLPVAYALSDLRGFLNARFSRDWAELALGFPYVAERSARAYKDIHPLADETTVRAWVVERYQTVAREELDGALVIAGRMDALKVDLTPMRALLAQRESGRGLVVALSHHDSFFVGMLALARCGLTAHLMISDVVFDERVHPKLRAFTRAKYDAYISQMNGGQFLCASAQTRAFFRDALLAGHVVMVVTDTPAEKHPDKGTWVRWLGKRRKMADGALRLAMETGSEMMAMRVRHEAPGRQVWSCSSLVGTSGQLGLSVAAEREAIYAPLAQFLERAIYDDTGRWSAAHLLGDFECDEVATDAH
jgi:lauroyl/myristoyl acyltransferase